MAQTRSKTAPVTFRDESEDIPNVSYRDKHTESHDEPPSLSSSSDVSTNSSDEFWEDAAKEAGEIKVFDDTRAKRGRWLYLSFMRLYRPVRIFIVAMFMAGITVTPYIVVKLSFPNSSAFPHVRAWSLWFTVSWACMTIVSILVDTLPRLIIYVFLTLSGKSRNRLATELEIVLAVVAWLKLALYSSILWIALSIMRAILHPPGTYWVIINRVVATLFTATMVLLVEKCFLHYVAIQFHKKALADRLLENKLALKALDRLSTAPSPSSNAQKRVSFGRKKSPKPSSSGVSRDPSYEALNDFSNSSGQHLDDVVIDVGTKDVKGARKKRKAVTSMILDQVGDAISSLALKDSDFHRRGVGSVHSARLLARKVFAGLSAAYPPRNLVVSDFYPYFPSREEAEIAFQLIDKDGNGDISRREMREAVQRIYRERKVLSSSLKDVGNIVAKLDGVLLAISLLVVIFASLLIFDRANTLSSLVPLATIVLGFSFVFGNSAQRLFESLIFIFSTHVFDIGDLIMIDDQILFVTEFGLFSTTFRRVDGQEIIAPNALLASSKLIHNLRRSSSMWETTTIHIDYNTPLEAVEELRTRLKAYINANNREWSDLTINIDKMEYQNAIYLNINMQHKSNWQNWGGRWQRRTLFMRHLKTLLEELEISYLKPLQPVTLHQQDLPSSPMQLRHSQTLRSPISPRGARGGSDSLGSAGLYMNTKRTFSKE